MKKFVIILGIFLFGASCNEQPPKNDGLVECKEKIDSLESYWKDVVRNLSLAIPDSVNWIDSIKYHDSVKINWIDSLRIKDSTVINEIDTTIYNFIDSLVIRDSVKMRDSLVLSLRESYEIPIDSVKVDSVASNRTYEQEANDLIDNKPSTGRDNQSETGTRWAVKGYPHEAILYFDTTYVVTEVWVNTYLWMKGYYTDIEIYHYADKITAFRTELDKLYTKKKIFYVGKHLYLRTTGGRNSWSVLGEIKVFGYKLEE